MSAPMTMRAAAAGLRLASALAPRNTAILLHLGRVRERLDDLSGAEDVYSKGVELGGSAAATFLRRRADIRARTEQWSAAIADCMADPGIVPPGRVVPRLAQHLRALGRIADARDVVQAAIDEKPSDKLLATLAGCYEDMGEFDAALAAYAQALRLKPGNLTIRTSLGMLHARRSLIPFDMSKGPSRDRVADGDLKAALDQAVTHLEAVVTGSQARTWAGYWLGRVLESHGALADAQRAYGTAVDRVQLVDKPWAHNASQAWTFRRDYVAQRRRQAATPPHSSSQLSDDHHLNRELTLGRPSDDVSDVAGFFEATITNIGLLIEGFVIAEHDDIVEIYLDGLPIMSVAGNSNPWVRSFKSTIVHNVLSEFPRQSTLTLRAADAPLVTIGGARSIDVAIPDGTDRLEEILGSGRTINKKGRWSSGSASESNAAAQLMAYDQARRVFADKLGIDLFVSYGTLLGCYRDGRPIPGDDDFDVSFVTAANTPEQLKAEVMDVMKALLSEGFDSRVAVDGRMFHLRVGDVVLDVNPFWFHDGRAWAFETHRLDPAAFTPVTSVEVDGIDVSIPAKPEAFLEDNYGPDWRTPRSDFQYHRAKADRAIMRKAHLVPSEVRELHEFAEQLRSTNQSAGRFHGYGDPADPRFQ